MLLVGCIPACKKDSNKNSGPAPAPGLSATETAILGKWYFQKIVGIDPYGKITVVDTTYHKYHDYLDFQSSVYPYSVFPNSYNLIYSVYGIGPTVSHWKFENNMLTTVLPYGNSTDNGQVTIITLNSTDLVYYLGDLTQGVGRYYYTRKP